MGGILFRSAEEDEQESWRERERNGTHQLLMSMYCGHTYDGSYENLPA